MGALTVNVEVPDGGMLTLSGARIGTMPGVGEYNERSTQSAKPPEAVIVIVELLEAPPAMTVRSWFETSEKPGPCGPGTTTVMSAEWNNEKSEVSPSADTV